MTLENPYISTENITPTPPPRVNSIDQTANEIDGLIRLAERLEPILGKYFAAYQASKQPQQPQMEALPERRIIEPLPLIEEGVKYLKMLPADTDIGELLEQIETHKQTIIQQLYAKLNG